MSDLDLDELHKEVSKLMDQASKPKAKKTAPKPTDKPEPTKETPKEPSVTLEPTPEAKEDTGARIAVRRSVAQIVPRRQGVAMDIVPPAKTNIPEPPSARASRTAPTLHPTGPIVPEPPHPRETTAAPEPPAKEDVSDATLASLNLQKDSPKPASEFQAHDVKPTFPDPLDVHGFTDGEDKASGDAPASNPPTMAHAVPVVEPPASKPTEEPAASPPAESGGTPFVNAKV